MHQIREFGMYFVIGAVATAIDWGSFALWLGMLGNAHYLSGLVLSLLFAGIFHYVANRQLTFRCDSRQFGIQIPLYILIILLGLGFSMLILAGLVRGLGLLPFPARVLTTALMLLPNYLMHRHLTFNRRLFA